jgi:2-hydroxy-3-oxopropionate reductase
MPMMLGHNFKPGFRLSLHKKDLTNVLETATATGVHMPLTEMVARFVDELVENGDAESDHSGLLKYYEKMNGTNLS